MTTPTDSGDSLKWETEGFNHRAQGMRRVYRVSVGPLLGINRFRPSIQRGAVSFDCNVSFENIEDAKHFCQSDHDSIRQIVAESTDQLRTDLHSCQVELERVRAEAAVMRSALDDICSQDYLTTCKEEDHPVSIASKAACSTDAGASLLARYREAVWLVDHIDDDGISPSEWNARRDTLLATVKGGS